MSRAYDQIRQVLDQQQPEGWRYNRVLARALMPIVRDTVARGFDTAAGILERPDPDGLSVPERLRKWASDARAANTSSEY